ncbi:hypothetical protein [Bdellovibrio sp. KM01]|uniref:hypothetical protein n=1 Tax=Bdellovibrio sp. KM01 TaxID=2748865 RepID=UPI0015EA8234|nr:hypothetical protein [Bdellovibrio sp. KM01]QLY26078.1 hypothetical protein HW988_03325 [Bdellovibrio sp. KM01]
MYIVPPPHPLLPASAKQNRRKRLLVRIFSLLSFIFLGLFVYQSATDSSLISAIYVAGFILSLVLADIFRLPSVSPNQSENGI